MERAFNKVEDIISHLKEYINNRIAQLKISAAEYSSRIIATFLSNLIGAFFFLCFIVFASIALALLLAKFTGEEYWGFLIVAALYLVLGAFFWKLRGKLIRRPIRNALLRQLFKEEEVNNDEKM